MPTSSSSSPSNVQHGRQSPRTADVSSGRTQKETGGSSRKETTVPPLQLPKVNQGKQGPNTSGNQRTPKGSPNSKNVRFMQSSQQTGFSPASPASAPSPRRTPKSNSKKVGSNMELEELEYRASNSLPVVLTEASIHEHEQMRDTEPLFDYTVELRPLRVNSFQMSKGVRNPDNYFLRAFHARSQGKLKMALSLYTKSLHLKPNDFKSAFNRGYIYDRMGYLEEARADYSYAATLEPKSSFAFFNRGIVEARLQKLDEAIETLTKAIDIQFKDVTALRQMMPYIDAGNDPDAYAEYEMKEQTSGAALVVFLRIRGLIHRRNSDFSKASRDYLEANKVLNPTAEDEQAERRKKKRQESEQRKTELLEGARQRIMARKNLAQRLSTFDEDENHSSKTPASSVTDQQNAQGSEYVQTWGERQLGMLLRDCLVKGAYEQYEEALEAHQAKMMRLRPEEEPPREPELVDFLDHGAFVNHSRDASANAYSIWKSLFQSEIGSTSDRTIVKGAAVGHGDTKAGREGGVLKEYRTGLEPSQEQESPEDQSTGHGRRGPKGNTLMQPYCFSDGPVYSPGNFQPTKNASFQSSLKQRFSEIFPPLRLRSNGTSVRADHATRNSLSPILKRDVDLLSRLTDSIRLFSNQALRVQQSMVTRLYWREAPQGCVICNEGELGDCLYVVVEGSVDFYLRRDMTSGRRIQQTFSVLKVGKFLLSWIHRFRQKKCEQEARDVDDIPPRITARHIKGIMNSLSEVGSQQSETATENTRGNSHHMFGIHIGSVYSGEGFGQDTVSEPLQRVWSEDANDYKHVRFRQVTAVAREPSLLLALRRDDYDYVMKCHKEVILAEQAAWLRKLPLFEPASRDEITYLAQRIQHRRFRCGEVILSQHGKVEGLYILRSGKCVVVRDNQPRNHEQSGSKENTQQEGTADKMFRRASMSGWIDVNEKMPRSDGLSRVSNAAANAAKAKAHYHDDISLQQVGESTEQSRRFSNVQLGSEMRLQRRLSSQQADVNESSTARSKPQPPPQAKKNVSPAINRKQRAVAEEGSSIKYALNPSSTSSNAIQYLGELFPRDWFGEAYVLSAKNKEIQASTHSYLECIENAVSEDLGTSQATLIAQTDGEVWILKRQDIFECCSFQSRQKMRELLENITSSSKIFTPKQQRDWTEYKKIILNEEISTKSATARF